MFFHEDAFEAFAGQPPGVTFDVHRGRVPHEFRFAVTVARLTELARLLEHLGGDALVAAFEITVGRSGPLFLLAEDRPRGLVVVAITVQLGTFEKAVLVVPDLGRTNELAGLDEAVDGLVVEIVIPQQIGRLEHLALLLEAGRLLEDLLRSATAGTARALLLRRVFCGFSGQDLGGPPSEPTARERQKHETRRQEHIGQEGLGDRFLETDRRVAGHSRALLDHPAVDGPQLTTRLVDRCGPVREANEQRESSGREKHEGSGQ